MYGQLPAGLSRRWPKPETIAACAAFYVHGAPASRKTAYRRPCPVRMTPASVCREPFNPGVEQADVMTQLTRRLILIAIAVLALVAVLVVQPPPEDLALSQGEMEVAIDAALVEASEHRIRGQQVTPFLLSRVSQLTCGASLQVNLALLLNNARLAASIAHSLVSVE